jgi:hypothetical protein
MIFNVQHTANWEYIRQCKQKLIKKNNNNENAKCIPHTYKVGDKVMLCKGSENKYEQPYSASDSVIFQWQFHSSLKCGIGFPIPGIA